MDIDGVVEMLTEEATFSMPPQTTWFGGKGGPREMRGFLEMGPMTGEWDWRHIETVANGQPALGFYCWYEPDGRLRPVRPQRPQLRRRRARKINDVTCFITRTIESDDPEFYARWPKHAVDPRRLEDFFLRFGLPARIDA